MGIALVDVPLSAVLVVLAVLAVLAVLLTPLLVAQPATASAPVTSAALLSRQMSWPMTRLTGRSG